MLRGNEGPIKEVSNMKLWEKDLTERQKWQGKLAKKHDPQREEITWG